MRPEFQRQYTIGQLARAAGVSTSTLRFYERRGLLKPEARTGGNYRAYGPPSLERLRFIRTAQSAGLSLQDVEALFELADGSAVPCEEVQSILHARLREVEERIKVLRQVRKTLESSLEVCRCAPGAGLCADIGKLKRSAF